MRLYQTRVAFRLLLIRLGLRRATLGDAFDRLVQHRDMKEQA